MALNIGGSGTIRPYAKYNAKADKWFVRAPEGGDKEIPRPTFLIDLKNISTGWFRFLEGQAPERRIDPSLAQPAPSPGDGFKRGFVVMAFSQKFFGGAVEFGGASIHLANAIRDIYAKYEEEVGKDENRGKVPVITCVGSEAMKDRFGTNYRPKFELVKFADRPAELPDTSPVNEADVWKGNAPAQAQSSGASHVSPPQPKPAAAPANNFDTEF
jgi:hypothetical protein